MPNKIIVEVEALDYTVNERDIAEALKAHFPNMPTRVREIRPTPAAPDLLEPALVFTCRVTVESYKNCDAHGNRKPVS